MISRQAPTQYNADRSVLSKKVYRVRRAELINLKMFHKFALKSNLHDCVCVCAVRVKRPLRQTAAALTDDAQNDELASTQQWRSKQASFLSDKLTTSRILKMSTDTKRNQGQ
jgi:hypothetical protein